MADKSKFAYQIRAADGSVLESSDYQYDDATKAADAGDARYEEMRAAQAHGGPVAILRSDGQPVTKKDFDSGPTDPPPPNNT